MASDCVAEETGMTAKLSAGSGTSPIITARERSGARWNTNGAILAGGTRLPAPALVTNHQFSLTWRATASI